MDSGLWALYSYDKDRSNKKEVYLIYSHYHLTCLPGLHPLLTFILPKSLAMLSSSRTKNSIHAKPRNVSRRVSSFRATAADDEILFRGNDRFIPLSDREAYRPSRDQLI
jgi:hypothetical protein